MKQTRAKTEHSAANSKSAFWPEFIVKCLLCLMAAGGTLGMLQGCGTRTIYIKNGEPVRLRQTIPKVKVWVTDKNGKETPGTVDLPEGWFSLPDDKVPAQPKK